MCTLMRSHDWAHTPLGPVRQWPQSLRTALSIVLNSRCPMFILWGSERVMLYNDGYRPMLDDQHPSALGRPAPEIWPDFGETLGPIIRQVIDQGESVSAEPLPRGMHQNGSPGVGAAERRSFACSYSPIRDESGGVGGLFCVCTEAARRDTEQPLSRLTQVLESLSDGFVAFDRDWRITYQNAAGEQINSKPRQEVLGRTCWEEWPALAGSELESHYRRAMIEQVTIHLEHHYVEPPNHDVWFEIHAYPSDEGLNVFYRDISDRKRAEAELQTETVQVQQKLAEIETIYQSAPIGLGVLDRELCFVRINQRLAEMNGLPIEAHLGRTVRELLPNLADQAETMLLPIFETGEPLLKVDIIGETPAQIGVQRAWVESFWPLREGDRIIGISIVCEEVTERRRIKAERQQALADLHQVKEELEQRVAERTAELSEINADLRERKSILRSLFESAAMPMGVIELYDDDILHISNNGAAAEFFGIDPLAMQNRFASELGVSTAVIQRWSAYYREAERTQAPVRFEYLHDSPEGPLWLSGSVCPIAGRPTGQPRFSYILEDITERKQAEETLARREEQLRLTFDFTHIGSWDWDVRQNTVIWNDNHFKLLGIDPNDTDDPYQCWRRAIHPDDLERVEQALQDALHQHTDYDRTYAVG
ncbi:MAG: hypothetical protein OHK0035_31270 [Cyanobacteria bacterium J069]